MKKLPILIPRKKIEEFCKRWKIIKFYFFGSILRKDFHTTSDIDVLVEFSDKTSWGLFDHAAMEEELSKILKRPVDIVNKKVIINSRNWIRKQNILESARIYYAA
jgi:predicted nucleotidyltransferase